MTDQERLRDFVCESNYIEGIVREPTDDEIKAHAVFLSCPNLHVGAVCALVRTIARAPIRDRSGMDVRVGAHFPPPGGEAVRDELTDLLIAINDGDLTPYGAHLCYEQLHPFMDGNGRSGRAIWAWQMRRDGCDPFSLSFLHRFYYQTLDTERTGQP